MEEFLTYEQLKGYFVRMCNEGEEYFADGFKELKDYFIQKSRELKEIFGFLTE